MKVINYAGKTVSTVYWREISDSLAEQLKSLYYTKPSKKDVIAEMVSIYKGGTKNSAITAYFVKDLMAKVKLYHSPWCIEDVFNCKDILAHFVDLVESKDSFYPKDVPLIENIETAFRLGGKGFASKPSNFPLNAVNYMLSKYNVNNNYYDFSCGWGVRLTGALANRINYFGTDPNYVLLGRLNELSDLYKYVTVQPDLFTDIRCQGSEVFVSDWKNKIGLAFSSPPYFYLEDYKIGDQSYTDGISYDEWLNNYMRNTIKNIHRYLIDSGIFAININNFDKFDLVGDVKYIALSEGFEYRHTDILKNIQRCNAVGQLNDNSEGIMIFTKKRCDCSLINKLNAKSKIVKSKIIKDKHKLF